MIPKFSLVIGVLQISRKNCFAIASDVPGILFLPFVVLVSRRRRFRQVSPILFDGIFSVAAVSSCSVRRRGKIEVIEELDSGIILVIY